MNSLISDAVIEPFSGSRASSLVVFIHGYGANGHDLLTLGHNWTALLPHTEFIAPNGFEVCEENPLGFQWFSLRDWDPIRILREIKALESHFNNYLDSILEKRGLSSHNLALVGFSQGAILALHMALHRPGCTAVIGYSGAYIPDNASVVNKPHTLLVHGKEDTVLNYEETLRAEKNLSKVGICPVVRILSNIGHSIDLRGLTIGIDFLRQHLQWV